MSSRGRTLRDVLETGKPLPPDQAFSICIDLARLLEGTHRLNNVYGGIFPDQVHFEPDGMVQIFALAAPREVDDLTLSYLCFVPPELLQGKRATAESDIYSFGAILYSLLTGRVPFDTGSQEQLRNDIEHSLIKPLPPLPANGNHADWIIKKCMNPVANRRYLNAQELTADLRKLSRVARPLPGNVPHHTAPKGLQTPVEKSTQILKQHPKIFAIAGAVILVLVAALIFYFVRKSDSKISKSSWYSRPVTTTPEVEHDPALSPAGDSVAYVSNITGSWEIYVRSVSGGEPQAVTQSPGTEGNPKWSPDGKEILYTYHGPGVPSTLFTVTLAGGIPQKIADHSVDGQWSPDGTAICYVTPAEEKIRSLIVLDTKESKTKTLLQSERGLAHPSFSKDGKEIVVEADIENKHGLLLVDVDSGDRKILTRDAFDYYPTWSWVTGNILFSSRRDGNLKIWEVDTDGNVKKITDGKGDDYRPVPAMKGTDFVFYRENQSSEIQSVNIQTTGVGSESTLAAKSFYPRSISGESFVFFSERGKGLELLWGMVGSSVASTVMQSVEGSSAIATSQDGSYIYIEAPADSGKGLMQISLKDGINLELGSTMVLPYEVSPDKKLLFYAVRQGDGVLYRLKDLKTQQDENLFMRPYNVRILRAFWLDNFRLIWISADHVVSLWSLKENKTSALITGCFDFALRPHSEVAAAILGTSPTESALYLVDIKSGRRSELLKFYREKFSRNVDWSRDGKSIYYDRFRTETELFIAE
ncbi:protein kinase [bacterium]|nr:protein kinase [bacterium]